MTASLQSLQERYRGLRARMRDNFVVIGEGPGRSLPYSIWLGSLYWQIYSNERTADGGYYGEAAWRAEQAHPNDIFAAEAAFNTDAGTRNGWVMGFGDTTVGQGFYLGLLATEVALLDRQRDPNQAYRDALYYELDCALEALARLDRTAHEVFGETSDGYQGYFLRDDARVDFYLAGPTLGPNGTGFIDGQFGAAASDFIEAEHEDDWPKAANGTYATMSQDQLIFVMMGLALVGRLVPVGAPSTISGGSLRDKAHRLIEGVVTTLAANGSNIKAPDGTLNRAAGQMAPTGYCAGIYKVAEHVLGRQVIQPVAMQSALALFNVIGEASAASMNERKMVRMLSCLGDILHIDENVRRCLKPKNQYDIYPLVQAVVWGQRMSDACEADLQAKLLPKLEVYPANPGRPGGRNNAHPLDAVDGWNNGNRWVHNGVDELVVSPNTRDAAVLYPGIGFMLAYNLYHLYFHPTDRTYRPYEGAREVAPDFTTFERTSSPWSFGVGTRPTDVRDALHYEGPEDAVYFRGVSGRIHRWKATGQPEPIHAHPPRTAALDYQLPRGKIYYVGPDGRMYNYYRTGDGRWHHAALRGDITNCTADFVCISGAVLYRGTDNRAYRFWWQPGGWRHECVNPDVRNVAGDLIWHGNRLFYRGTDGRLHQLAPVQTPWAHWPTCACEPIKDNLFYAFGIHHKFFYRGADNAVHSTMWSKTHGWLSGRVCPDATDVGDRLLFNKADQRLYYVGLRHRLHEVFWADDKWNHKSTRSIDDAATADSFVAHDGKRIYARTEDGGLMYWFQTDGGWKPIRTSTTQRPITGPIVGNAAGDRIYFRSMFGSLGWFSR